MTDPKKKERKTVLVFLMQIRAVFHWLFSSSVVETIAFLESSSILSVNLQESR